MHYLVVEIVGSFANGMMAVDSYRPVAINVRSKKPYQAGIGPHTERQTVKLVADELTTLQNETLELEVPYPNSPRSKCDLCIYKQDKQLWALEIKMLRLMGDNGKPNDNILMHILSPYPEHRSAVTDCVKLFDSGLPGRKAILIYGYDYDDWPMEPAIEAFEVLANYSVELSPRVESQVDNLIHPVHKRGKVFGWEILPTR